MNNYTPEQKSDFDNRVKAVNDFIKSQELAPQIMSFKERLGETESGLPIMGDVISIVFKDLKYENNTTNKESMEDKSNGNGTDKTNSKEISNG